ncbi:hypothetical protein CEN50_17550 [Fischerella thermalis CCMEE 5268]|uniref:Uncharacterized protein n=1 Tax=Fischerella thermalis CCMEE 5268 TaxID=2019662 RepID=A0A2N6KD68_9CYAN|nr:hypothetical protein [Fischerella thermalis]PLZ96721.1 hypothetical protein CEN50_17550 [Fischerella thermalis CCMEE 5268]
MASQNEVKKYLAYWFQLGKKVIISNGVETLLPKPVIAGDRYSDEFEECWRKITSEKAGDCYLEGTSETIAELLTSDWEMFACSRCTMPIPVRSMGMPAESCPCNDLSDWPNTEVPLPRGPVNSQVQLKLIRDQLVKMNELSHHSNS